VRLGVAGADLLHRRQRQHEVAQGRELDDQDAFDGAGHQARASSTCS
jgi:hypothetical protein